LSRPTVRDAEAEDLPAVLEIYGQDVSLGTGTFELEVPDLDEMARRHSTVLALGLPWLVAETESRVTAFAYAAPFRLRPAYRYTVEDSIYVHQLHRGKGLGRLLLTELVARCNTLGLRQMLAVIGDSSNHGSIALHTACGFSTVGTMASVGWKFDAWRDVVIMQRPLGAGATSGPDASGMPMG
jgi:phosphinothricin acetyltransferase